MLDVAVDKESPVITTTLETSPAVLAGTGGMEQHWQGFGYYYPEGQHRDAHPHAPNESHSVPTGHEHATSSHHRANTFPQRQQSVSSYHPARPPSTGPPGPGQNGSPHHLPPFAQFYPQQHYQPPPTQSPTQTSHSSGYSHSYVTSTSPNTAYSSYTTGSHLPSPASASGSRGPPPSHSYPPPQALRTQFTNGAGPDYSTSPHPRQLSPTSPASRAPMTAPSSGPGPGPKRRSHSASYSNGSWDEDKHGDGLGETNEKEPWGMPQDEYRALNPRDKKQVRNRIGARRFRAKRKDYVASLEASIQTRNDEIESLRAQLEGARVEIAGYRDRLGLPVAGTEDGGLGLQGAR